VQTYTLKELIGDLSIRPIYHQTDERIDAHIFVAFMAYCLRVALKHQADPTIYSGKNFNHADAGCSSPDDR
jgi:transposase